MQNNIENSQKSRGDQTSEEPLEQIQSNVYKNEQYKIGQIESEQKQPSMNDINIRKEQLSAQIDDESRAQAQCPQIMMQMHYFTFKDGEEYYILPRQITQYKEPSTLLKLHEQDHGLSTQLADTNQSVAQAQFLQMNTQYVHSYPYIIQPQYIDMHPMNGDLLIPQAIIRQNNPFMTVSSQPQMNLQKKQQAPEFNQVSQDELEADTVRSPVQAHQITISPKDTQIEKINELYDFLRLRSQNNQMRNILNQNTRINFDNLYQNGEAANRNHDRIDVHLKKILRACRQYYDNKLDQEFQIKMHRRRVDWDDQIQILNYTKAYCQKFFHPDLLDLYDISLEQVANHLATFLCAKKTFGKQIDSKPAQAQHQVPKNESQKDFQRIAEIVDLVDDARNLLYNYNNKILNKFMTKVGNILILEKFLSEQNNFFIDHQLTENANADPQPQEANNGGRRKKKQAAKELQFLSYDPKTEKKRANIKKFTDYFKPKNIKIKYVPLDKRDHDTKEILTDQFKRFSHQIQRNCWLALEKKI